MKLRSQLTLSGVAAALALASFSADARACGGFFCSQSQPVNQAAERIIFADNGDGTVTAVIQIMYEGPSENFSWLLPLPTVPDPENDEIAVASDLAFQRLQRATNPQYSLTTRVEGQCRDDVTRDGVAVPNGTGAVGAGGTAGEADNDGVTVEASGVVGSFEWTVISFDSSLDDPADAAVMWLTDNDYDVTDDAPDLIGPYLDEGMYLLALKLVKGADAGSIRPIVLTYDAGLPSIPIKLTAVAANDDMGVMTWIGSDARAVPENYMSLELNEARINWFNASSNYADVVNEAADEAGGQGFVTEAAFPAEQLANVVWTAYDDYRWEDFSGRVYSSFGEMFNWAYNYYGGWDGFWDAVQASVTLPDTVSFEDFKLCPSCYESQIEFSPSELMANVEESVIEPVRLVQDLLDRQRYVTRLYTTLSADEMTVDPVFTFNEDLDDVSNIHTAERIIECDPSVSQSEAPWRIELPQGGVIRGEGQQVGTWPTELLEQPANRQVLQLSASGDGEVTVDNQEVIEEALSDYNASVAPDKDPDPAGQGGAAGGAGEDNEADGESGGGCSVSTDGQQGSLVWLVLSGLGLALLGRRRRQ